MLFTGNIPLPITNATLVGIRRDGKERGRGQVDGLIWQDLERVYIQAETEGSLAGLRDSAGASVVDRQVAGRWKSSQMPAHYAKAELAERGAIARFKDGKLL